MITLPTLQQLYADFISNLEAEYGISISPVGKSMLRALAAVQSAKMKLYYLVIGNLQKNIFADTADSEQNGGTLERFGRVKLGRNPFPAKAGQYTVQLNGTAGAKINASTTFKSDDDALNSGALLILDTDYTLVTGTDTISLRCLKAGTVSKLNLGDTLTATSPIANVSSSVVVTAETTAPLDAETIEEYRQEVLNSYRLNPQGGSATDYRLWSQDAQGVKQVYPYAKNGAANEINIFVEADIADSQDGKGTPPASMLADVAQVIEFNPDTTLPVLQRGRRPLGIFDVHVLPITIITVDIVITGYQGLTPTIQTLLLNALTDMINNVRPFVSAADDLVNKNDVVDINKVIATIITQTPGAIFTGITIKINGNPLLTYTFIDGNIPYLNSVTYN